MHSIVEQINHYKKQKNAIILAHYYQNPEIKEVADFIGDSYYLSTVARQTHAQTILFCGVRFMAESAKILSPEKKILLPNENAGCPMADMATEEKLYLLIQAHPDAAVVCYINSPAEIKALSDVCVTSGNAVAIISKLPQEKIIFLPDQNLCAYVAAQCPEKQFIYYPGYCIVHNRIIPEEIQELKALHPNALVAVHPECRKEVVALADFVGSTEGILKYARNTTAREVIVVTEEGIAYELAQQNPHKSFYFPVRVKMICQNMKKTMLADVIHAFETDTHEIQIDETLRQKAFHCLEQMHLYAMPSILKTRDAHGII